MKRNGKELTGREVLRLRDASVFFPSDHMPEGEVKRHPNWKKETSVGEATQCALKTIQRIASLHKGATVEGFDLTLELDSAERWRLDNDSAITEDVHGLSTADTMWLMLAMMYSVDKNVGPRVQRGRELLDDHPVEEFVPTGTDDEIKRAVCPWTDDTFHEAVLLSEIKCRLMTFHWTTASDLYADIQIQPPHPPMDAREIAKLAPGTVPEIRPVEQVYDARTITKLGHVLQELSNSALLVVCAAFVVSQLPRAYPLLVSLAYRLHHHEAVYRWTTGQFDEYTKCIEDDQTFEESRRRFKSRWIVSNIAWASEDSWERQYKSMLENLYLPAGCAMRYRRLTRGRSDDDHTGLKFKRVADELAPRDWCADKLLDQIDRESQKKAKMVLEKDVDAYDAMAFCLFAFIFRSMLKVDFIVEYTRITESLVADMRAIVTTHSGTVFKKPRRPIIVVFRREVRIAARQTWILCKSKLDAVVNWCHIVMTQFDGTLENGLSIAKVCDSFYIKPKPVVVAPISVPPSPDVKSPSPLPPPPLPPPSSPPPSFESSGDDDDDDDDDEKAPRLTIPEMADAFANERADMTERIRLRRKRRRQQEKKRQRDESPRKRRRSRSLSRSPPPPQQQSLANQ